MLEGKSVILLTLPVSGFQAKEVEFTVDAVLRPPNTNISSPKLHAP